MIPYHGGPFSDKTIAAHIYRGRHALVSFARPEQMALVASLVRSFSLDNGAFSAWKSGTPIRDWRAYYEWVAEWRVHPAFQFAIVPDVIDGSEQDNDDLVAEWPFTNCGVPVLHLDESLTRLERLARSFSCIALGSSGKFRTPGSLLWWDRMATVMETLCDERGYPKVKLHGLRMLAPKLIDSLPLSSADSSTVSRTINLETKWQGSMAPATRLGRALAHCDRIESVLPATFLDRIGRIAFQ